MDVSSITVCGPYEALALGGSGGCVFKHACCVGKYVSRDLFVRPLVFTYLMNAIGMDS